MPLWSENAFVWSILKWTNLFAASGLYPLNSEVLEDFYGEPIREATIDDVIAFLENELISKEYYRRIPPLLNMLKGFDKGDWNNLTVLHFGH